MDSISGGLRGVVEAFETIINNEKEEGGLLEGVKSVVYSERSSKNLQKPIMWIYPGRGRPVELTNFREVWDFPFLIVSLVNDSDEKEGMMRATDLVSNFRKALINSPDLGRMDYVSFVKVVQIIPGSSDTMRGNDHSANLQVMVRFTVNN